MTVSREKFLQTLYEAIEEQTGREAKTITESSPISIVDVEGPGRPQTDPIELDALDVLELMMTLEDKLDVEIDDPSEHPVPRTVGELADAIRSVTRFG